MYSMPQTVLSAVLTIKNTTPERLSTSERSIADRICHCTECNYLWVRNPGKLPNRCPHCHRRDWDRPLLTALVAQSAHTTEQHATATSKKEQEDKP